MSLKHRLKETYLSIRNSKRWKTNQALALLHPVARLSGRSLVLSCVYIYKHIYKPIRRSRPSQFVRSGVAKARKKVLNARLSTIYFRTARKAASRQDWVKAGAAYARALAKEKVSRKPRLEFLNEAKFNLSLIDRLIDQTSYRGMLAGHAKNQGKRRIAIYTAIAGGYDSIKPPAQLIPDADYYIFSDMPVPSFGFYKIRPLPYFHIDTPRMTRYVKTHPHQLLAGYDIAIWIDANILITGDIVPLVEEFVKSKKPVGAIEHPLRKTLDQEAKACIRYSKEDDRMIKEQLLHYKSLNYRTNKLIESNIMFFDLKSKKVPSFLTTWWSEIDQYTRRDQLSLNYSLDKNKVSWHRIMKRPHDARNHALFTLVPHKKDYSSLIALTNSAGAKKANPSKGDSFSTVKKTVVSRQRGRKIDVVYCVHNALEDVKICLASVVKHRISPNLKLIIVDDASDAPTATFLKDFAKKHKGWCRIIRNEVAGGYTKAVNAGLKSTTGELAILLNSDTIVTDGWSEKMAEAVFATPGGGIVGPLSSAASHQSVPNHIGTSTQTATNDLPKGLSPEEINKHCEQWSIAGYYPHVPLVHGFCFGVTREVLNKVGYFDEKSFPYGYGEENDYCFRAIDAGFVLVLATNTYIFHAKSKSYADDRRIKLMKQGALKLRELRGKGRIERAIKSVLANPYLQTLRDKTRKLYARY